jgi:hypothetical protein
LRLDFFPLPPLLGVYGEGCNPTKDLELDDLIIDLFLEAEAEADAEADAEALFVFERTPPPDGFGLEPLEPIIYNINKNNNLFYND